MNFMRWLIPAPKMAPAEPAPLLDLRRRGFIFGAAATLIIPPVRTFHFLPKPELVLPELITAPEGKLFDLPNREALQLWTKLIDEHYKMSDIPRWVVCDKEWYDDVVKAQERGAKWDAKADRSNRTTVREAHSFRSHRFNTERQAGVLEMPLRLREGNQGPRGSSS